MTVSTSTRRDRDGIFKRCARLETHKAASEYFETHSRIRTHDTMRSSSNISLSWNCDGTKIATGSQDGSVTVSSVDAGFRLKTVFHGNGHTNQACGVSFHPSNSNLFASVSLDKSVCLWDVRNSRSHTTISTKSGNLSLTWSPCGRWLVYLDKDDRIHLIDGRTLNTIKPAYDFKTTINELCFDSTGQFLFVATGSGKVEVLSMPDLSAHRTLQAHSSGANCIAMASSPDGKRLAVGANDALVSIWDVDDLYCERNMSRMDWPLRSLSFSHDGRLLASGSEDHYVDIAWVEDGTRVHEIKTDSDVFALKWHPSQFILAMVLNETPQGRDRCNLRLFGLHV